MVIVCGNSFADSILRKAQNFDIFASMSSNYEKWFMSKLFKKSRELKVKTPFIFTDPKEGMGHCNGILVS